MALKSSAPVLVPTFVKILNSCVPTQFLSVNLMSTIEVLVVATNVVSIVASVVEVGVSPETKDMYLT